MRKMKKMTAVLLCILMAMSMLGAVSYAAETECEHNFSPRYIDGKWYEACDFCDAKTCACSFYGYDYEYGEDYTYEVCRNCGKKTVFCDHSDYDFVGYNAYAVYCHGGDEKCSCGQAVKSGTKHQLGEYDTEKRQYECKLCDGIINFWSYEDAVNLLVKENADGSYSGEWVNLDLNTGEVSGEGTWTFDKNGVLTFLGKGEVDISDALSRLSDLTKDEKVCDYCVRASQTQDENGKMIVLEEEVVHASDILTKKLKKLVLGEGITSMYEIYDVYSALIEEVVLPDSFKGGWCNYDYEDSSHQLLLTNATVKLPAGTELPDSEDGVAYIDNVIIDKNSLYYSTDDEGNIYNKDKTVFYKYQGKGKSFTVPSTVKEIADFAFSMTEIEAVVLPAGVKKIGDYAFYYALKLKSVNLPYGLEFIGENAFEASRIEKISIPDSVKEIGKNVFSACVCLKEAKLPDGLSVIPKEAFSQCMSLKSVNIPSAVKEIGVGAFSWCSALESLVIPEAVETIGSQAFDDCLSLTDFTVASDDVDLSESFLGFTEVDMRGEIRDIYVSDEFVQVYWSLIGKNKEYDTEKYDNFLAAGDCRTIQLEKKFLYALMNSYNSAVENGVTYFDDLVIYCHEGSSAEAYAIENGIKYVSEVCEHNFGEWVTDTANSIKYKTCSKCGKTYEEELTADDDNIGIEGNEGENKFTVKLIENPESTEYIYIRGLLEGNIIALYDINLLDENGNKVQPDGMVKVSLPLGEDVKYFTVLRVNDDGTLTDMKAVREGDSVVFETDHFSYYVILGGETEADTGDNIKCNCFCHIHPLLEMLMKLFKILTKLYGGPLTFPCDC